LSCFQTPFAATPTSSGGRSGFNTLVSVVLSETLRVYSSTTMQEKSNRTSRAVYFTKFLYQDTFLAGYSEKTIKHDFLPALLRRTALAGRVLGVRDKQMEMHGCDCSNSGAKKLV
jgi:hypothetical protein